MAKRSNHILVLIVAAVCIAACATEPTPTSLPTPAPPTRTMTVAVATNPPPTVASPTEPAGTDTPVPPTIAPSTSPTATSGTSNAAVDQVIGTVVRFSARSTSVDVTIGEDSPGVRDFLSMLPLTLTLEDLVGREKIAYLPRELAHAGSPGTDPDDGDLIYYIPWGNLGFYYNAAGIGYSDQTIHLGTYAASREQLRQLEGPDVSSRSSADADATHAPEHRVA